MKKLSLIFATILGISIISNAQVKDGHSGHRGGQKSKMAYEEKVNFKTDKMKEALGLSDEQYKQVLALNTKMANEMKESRKAIKGNYQNDLKGILSPEQYAKFEEFKNKKLEDRDPQKMAQMRTDKMKESLNLTDDQYRKVLALNLLKAETMQKNHEMSKEAMKKENDQYRESLKSILTPEQLEKLKQERKDGPKGKDNIHRKGDK